MAKPFVGDSPFMVCAGDTYIASRDNGFLGKMVEAFSKGVTAMLLQRVEDPRRYGVALTREWGEAANSKWLRAAFSPKQAELSLTTAAS